MNTKQDTTLKCRCNHCPGEIDFTVEQSGETVTCPHCNMETILATPHVRAGSGASARRIRWQWVVVVALACAFAGLAIYVVSNYFDQIVTMVGGTLAAGISLFIGLCALVVVVLWLLFPVFMYFKMNELIAEVRKLRAEK